MHVHVHVSVNVHVHVPYIYMYKYMYLYGYMHRICTCSCTCTCTCTCTVHVTHHSFYSGACGVITDEAFFLSNEEKEGKSYRRLRPQGPGSLFANDSCSIRAPWRRRGYWPWRKRARVANDCRWSSNAKPFRLFGSQPFVWDITDWLYIALRHSPPDRWEGRK